MNNQRLAGKVLDKDAPARNVRGCHEELLTEPPLDHDVPAGDLSHVPLIRATAGAQVGVAFPDSQEAGALLGGALGLATASGKPVLAVSRTQTELLAEVRHLDAGTVIVARLAWVVARVVVMHRLGPVIFFQLNLLTMNRPESVLLLFLLLRRSELLHGLCAEVLLLCEAVLVNLSASLGHQHLGHGAMIAGEDSPEHPEHALLAPGPGVSHLARARSDVL